MGSTIRTGDQTKKKKKLLFFETHVIVCVTIELNELVTF